MLDGSTQSVAVDDDTTMLEAMLDAGLEPSHDCKMGVCMTCPARLVRHLQLWPAPRVTDAA